MKIPEIIEELTKEITRLNRAITEITLEDSRLERINLALKSTDLSKEHLSNLEKLSGI